MSERFFDEFFKAATGFSPFPWQGRLYERLVKGEIPPACNLPTGLGKTSVIAIWLLALAEQAPDCDPTRRLPRRLVYVVNRRTIVDQATGVAEELRQRLEDNADLHPIRRQLQKLRGGESEGDCDAPLAISTLRGQFADNGEWSANPARPAIIIGTVDMIGSRLLFSGYGRGFKSRPLHAGFLGQDTLLVHDEAHLELAFQHLLETIRKEQTEGRCRDFRPLRVLPLTATPRTASGEDPFELDKDDFQHKIIKQRLEAKKMICLHPLDDKKSSDGEGERDQSTSSKQDDKEKKKRVSPSQKIVALALARARENRDWAILVFQREVRDVLDVAAALAKADGGAYMVEPLTGTLRGLDRDALVKTPVFQRFLQPSNRDGTITPAEGTVFLVCTSAGEVGVDISADHLVCDLTTFDSMAQRFGRVNRYGDGDAIIDVVHPKGDALGEEDVYDARRSHTLALLKKLNGDGSPKAIGELPLELRMAAFSPTPTILDATNILFDAWALTTIREKMPGRPPVSGWLHGIPSEWQPPETQVAWREEVQWITGELLDECVPDDLLEAYPIKPHELLKDRSRRVFDELKQMAKRFEGEKQNGSDRAHVPVWIEDDRGVEVTTLQQIVDGDEDAIANRTIILPPYAGGLTGGMLNGKSPSASDVADEWFDEEGRKRRARVWDEWEEDEDLLGMRPVRSAIDLDPKAEELNDGQIEDDPDAGQELAESQRPAPPKPPGRLWMWYALPRSADDDGSRTASQPVELKVHNCDVRDHAQRIVKSLGLAETPEGRALVFAAEAHDLGKDRGVWQRSIWNNEYPGIVLAKSGHRRPPRDFSSYRHEFGSLLDVLSSPEKNQALAAKWAELNELARDLALHFIAAHHGRGRPHFPADEAFDPGNPSRQAATVAREVPCRFARLQRMYGRWGLAYLESILRAADAAASAEPSETVEEDADAATVSLTAGGAQ